MPLTANPLSQAEATPGETIVVKTVGCWRLTLSKLRWGHTQCCRPHWWWVMAATLHKACHSATSRKRDARNISATSELCEQQVNSCTLSYTVSAAAVASPSSFLLYYLLQVECNCPQKGVSTARFEPCGYHSLEQLQLRLFATTTTTHLDCRPCICWLCWR